MRTKQIVIAGVLVFNLFWVISSGTAAQSMMTTTLLPTKDKILPKQGLYRISSDKNHRPVDTVSLEFDLRSIPSGSVINKAVLQLVAKPAKEHVEQGVKIVPDGKTRSVASWTATDEECCAFPSEDQDLSGTIESALESKKLGLTLKSESYFSNWQYYSMDEYGGISSNKPRLIIEYLPSQDLLEREQERDTTKTRWKFYPRPSNVTVKPFLNNVTTIISNPVFYDGGIYLFAQPSSEETMLYALYPGGGNVWDPKKIEVRPGSHALVTNSGRLYSVGENQIVIYALKKKGALIKSLDKEKEGFKPIRRPTVGADGSLYAMPSGSGYIIGFNPDMEELWRYSLGDSKSVDASRITLSPDAGRYAYVLTKSGVGSRPVRIDTATGSYDKYDLTIDEINGDGKETAKKNLDLGFEELFLPVAIRESQQDYVGSQQDYVGSQQDYVFQSANTGQKNGILLAYLGGVIVWWQEGHFSQPIVDWEEKRVFAVQGKIFRGYDKVNGEEVCASMETDIEATSNLVKDGKDHVYFWNNGSLLGYTKDCDFLELNLKKLPPNLKLPKNLELMFGPEGTLFARTDLNRLYTMTIGSTQKELPISVDNLETYTIYSAKTIKIEANVKVTNEKIIIKAEEKITFGTSVSVKKGASLRCRIGF